MSETQSHQWPLTMRPTHVPSQAEPIEPRETRRKRGATEKQLRFARDLGLNVPDNITAAQISVLIDAALDDERAAMEPEVMPDGLEPWLRILRDSTTDDMLNELERRGMRAILLSWPPHSDTECTLNCGGFTVDEAKQCLSVIGHNFLRESDPNYDALYRNLED